MARASSLSGLLASALLIACGETHVTLLEPIADQAGGSQPSEPGGGDAGGKGGRSSSGEAGTSPGLNPIHLLHRYSFDGEGTLVRDSVGGAPGTLVGGAAFDGAGHVTLNGTDGYVDLPNGLISGLTDVTLVAWLSWNGGPCWQRVFDFGSSDAGEDHVGNATSSLFATPLRCGKATDGGAATGPATAFETSEVLGSVDSDVAFPVLNVSLLAVSIEAKTHELRLYAAGHALGTGKAESLALLTDENAWLGRSQWVQDDHLRGTYDEFRIYDVALSNAELAALEAAGPGGGER